MHIDVSPSLFLRLNDLNKMATESDLENEISPVDFIQLQEYIECKCLS